MPRAVSATFRATAEASSGSDVFLTFVTITHKDLAEPLRAVNDVVDYIYDGKRFVGCPFEITILTDSEDKPTAKISIQNVDRRIGEVILNLREAPSMKLEVILLSQFNNEIDQFEDARTHDDLPVPDYIANRLRLAKVSVDAMTVSASIFSYDYSSEPWPYLRGTKNRFPGLYR